MNPNTWTDRKFTTKKSTEFWSLLKGKKRWRCNFMTFSCVDET